MKLPDINQNALDAVCSAQPIELATLHCLRSIAVSLEMLAVTIGLDSELDPKSYDTVCDIAEKYSVVGRGIRPAKGKSVES